MHTRAYFAAALRHVQHSRRAAPVPVPACVQPLPSSNLRIGVIRSGGAAPFSSDSMLTTLQKGPKEPSRISGQFSHFPQTREVLNSING